MLSVGLALTMHTLYVGGLPLDMTLNGLRALFDSFGDLREARLVKHESGSSRGFGYVTFKTPNAAQQAQLELDGERLRNRRLRVAEAR